MRSAPPSIPKSSSNDISVTNIEHGTSAVTSVQNQGSEHNSTMFRGVEERAISNDYGPRTRSSSPINYVGNVDADSSNRLIRSHHGQDDAHESCYGGSVLLKLRIKNSDVGLINIHCDLNNDDEDDVCGGGPSTARLVPKSRTDCLSGKSKKRATERSKTR